MVDEGTIVFPVNTIFYISAVWRTSPDFLPQQITQIEPQKHLELRNSLAVT